MHRCSNMVKPKSVDIHSDHPEWEAYHFKPNIWRTWPNFRRKNIRRRYRPAGIIVSAGGGATWQVVKKSVPLQQV
jgi:hypothetical protein